MRVKLKKSDNGSGQWMDAIADIEKDLATMKEEFELHHQAIGANTASRDTNRDKMAENNELIKLMQ